MILKTSEEACYSYTGKPGALTLHTLPASATNPTRPNAVSGVKLSLSGYSRL
jgi:hypothetical protein